MSEKLNEIAKGSFLRVNEEGKAYWGQSEGGGGGSAPAAGGVTTLHINVTAVNGETNEATFTADKTPSEMQQAAVNGPVWCVISFPEGILGKDAVSIGLPPAFLSGTPAFGIVIAYVHDGEGDNKIGYAVKAGSEGWFVDLTQFGN